MITRSFHHSKHFRWTQKDPFSKLTTKPFYDFYI
uniref:Uncharacterized protein n=1 Tax=Lepeophtheirus salmonis TaxID=72036 RepID=A0A0K2U7Z6_LEPSM